MFQGCSSWAPPRNMMGRGADNSIVGFVLLARIG